MLVIAGGLIGAAIGMRRAARQGGNRLDRAQYAAVHAIVLGLLGLFITIALNRIG